MDYSDLSLYPNNDGYFTDVGSGDNYDANGNQIYYLGNGQVQNQTATSTINNWLSSGSQGLGSLASSLVNIGLTAAQIANALGQAGNSQDLNAQQLYQLQQERNYLLAQQNSQKSNTGLILLGVGAVVLFLVMREKK